MTPEQVAICEVLEHRMSSSLLKNVEEEITAKHGAAVYAQARRIIDEAIATPMNWSRDTMDDGLGRMGKMLDRKYPWLTRGARAGVAFGFTMTWK